MSDLMLWAIDKNDIDMKINENAVHLHFSKYNISFGDSLNSLQSVPMEQLKSLRLSEVKVSET